MNDLHAKLLLRSATLCSPSIQAATRRLESKSVAEASRPVDRPRTLWSGNEDVPVLEQGV